MTCEACSMKVGRAISWIAVFFCATPGPAFPAPADMSSTSLHVVQSKETVTVSAGGRQVLEYRQVPSPFKPYASKLFSPAGVQILRDSPGDHKHHHALMFALAADGVNFWEEAEGVGAENPRSLRLLECDVRSGMQHAGFTQGLEWVNRRENRVILEEQRTIEVLDAADFKATLLSWNSRLKPAADRDSVPLTGSHYFGLGMRFIESMDSGGRFFCADGLDGEVVRGSERLTATRWCAYEAPAGDQKVSVAVFDHPSNPRHPARMFTMTTPFAYLAATLNLWKEPLTLKRDAPLELVYGVAVWDGTVDPAQIEAVYWRWAR